MVFIKKVLVLEKVSTCIFQACYPQDQSSTNDSILHGFSCNSSAVQKLRNLKVCVCLVCGTNLFQTFVILEIF